MARKFTVELISQYILGTTLVHSSVEHSDLLGTADDLVFQVTTRNVSGSSPSMTVRYQHCNDGNQFVSLGTDVRTGAITEATNEMKGPFAGHGTFGRVEVEMSGSDVGAHLTVIACGRTQ